MLVEQGIPYTTDSEDKSCGNLVGLVYHWQFIPGMASGTHMVFCRSLSDLKKLIKIWNTDQPDTWHYWV